MTRTKVATATRKTPAQKAREKKAADAAKARLKKQRDKVKALQAKLKTEQKALEKLEPTKHVQGLARAAKAATKGLDKVISTVKSGKRVVAPKIEDRTVKPLEFIDGLETIKTYLIVCHKSEDKSIRLGVRFTDSKYRMHFYPNIKAHGSDRSGKMRPNKGYETIWVDKPTYEKILQQLRSRADTHNLPQELVERLVRARDAHGVKAALEIAG